MTLPEVPLLTEPLLGVRQWSTSDETKWELLLGFDGTPWVQDGRFTEAACLHDCAPGETPHTGKAPDGNCNCGLHAAHPFLAAVRHHHLEWPFRQREGPVDWLGQGSHPRADCVFGVIEATGRIEVHEHGFRAEFARPIGLVVPTRDPHRYHVVDLCRKYRAHRIDALLGETIESFVEKRIGRISEKTVSALLEPVRAAEREAEPASVPPVRPIALRAPPRPIGERLEETLPRPVYLTGLFVGRVAQALFILVMVVMLLLLWIVPVWQLVAAFQDR